MAKYLVLIYGNAQAWADLPAEWHAANAARHQALIASAGSSILGVNELEPASNAVSIRADPSGNPSITKGPFLDTPETVGGYYLLDAADLDEAIRLASRIPEATAAHGGVEIRPIASA
ncbi:MAG TPA: YciI family protein [Candidatus Limnocylindrales bacterium]|jgi:hypothetical protein